MLKRKKSSKPKCPYLEWIRSQVCAECGRPAEPHHFRGEFAVAGVGMTASNLLAIPLCREHHDWVQVYKPGWKEKQREWLVQTWVRAVAHGMIIVSPDAVDKAYPF